jgi:hypothetical protein
VLKYLRLQGHRLSDLLVVEFCNTADAAGVFRKYSAFVVGEQILPRHLIFGRHWNLKKPDLNSEDLSREQLEYLETNPHESFLRDIFRLAHVDYGRIDYSLAGDVPQVWEINTHPTVLRLAERLTAAFEAIDSGTEEHGTMPVCFHGETLQQVQRETQARAHNRALRDALSTLGSMPVLRHIKETLRMRLNS